MIIHEVNTPEPVADFTAEKLNDKLSANKKVLWLVSGGSAIDIAVQVSKLLGSNNLHNLYVTLTDERYGPVGHADSNWQQLLEAGFDLPKAKLFPVLIGQDLQATTDNYAKNIEDALDQADYSLGLFGMGRDGHTAGMLPHSPASLEQQKPAIQYKGSDFQRVTITSAVINRLDTAVLYAVGEEKALALLRLKTDVDVADQPAQALKRVKEFYVFTDNKGVLI